MAIKNTKKNVEKKPPVDKELISLILLCLSVMAVLFVSWTFTGSWPWTNNPYNSYMLQARSWLEGRLDLGQNYSHLELAVFNGKYYVSFPPLPSFIMLPFALIHWYSADGFIAVVSAMTAVIYAYKIMRFYDVENDRAMFFALFVTIGSNWLLIAQMPWVWFIAQSLAFTFSLMSIYYSLNGKLGASLALWACAVGCRPLNGLYLPVLLYTFYLAYKKDNPNATLIEIVKKKLTALIPMAVIAIVYMVLNFARFGNPLEFGHNYLPEFTEAAAGQFNIVYMKENLTHLIQLPKISFASAWEYPKFNGWCLFMVSPIFISYIAYTVYHIFKTKTKPVYILLILAVLVAELVLTTAHKTMGGWQFGNRYTIDVLPLAFTGIAAVLTDEKPIERLNYILFFAGSTLNIIGSVLLVLSK